MTSSVKLSVVVPTRNRRDVLIPRTLPAMFAQDMPADEFEIILVVDGSTDGTAQALRELKSPFPPGYRTTKGRRQCCSK